MSVSAFCYEESTPLLYLMGAPSQKPLPLHWCSPNAASDWPMLPFANIERRFCAESWEIRGSSKTFQRLHVGAGDIRIATWLGKQQESR